MIQYVEKLLTEKGNANIGESAVEIYKLEYDYIKRHQLLSEDKESSVSFVEQESLSRFQHNVYIERGNKETEEVIAEESSAFLEQPIKYFKDHIDEFMYMESPWFNMIGVDAISFEADSAFGNYDVMLGLKQPKKSEKWLKSFLKESLQDEEATFDLMFSANDGLWDLNFSLNDLNTFKEDWTILQAYDAIYELIFKLVEKVEEGTVE